MKHAVEELARGRESFSTAGLGRCLESLSRAGRAQPLGGEDVELLARSAYILGRDDGYIGGQNVHVTRIWMRRGFGSRALRLLDRSQLAVSGRHRRATGWFARAQQILEQKRISWSVGTC